MSDDIEIPEDIMQGIIRKPRRSVSSIPREEHGSLKPTTTPKKSPAFGPTNPEERKRAIYTQVFKKYDTNNSNSMDKNEFRQIIIDLEWDLTEEEIISALQQLDTSNNGTIELHEFLNWSEVAWSLRMTKPVHEIGTPRKRGQSINSSVPFQEMVLEETYEEAATM